MGVVILLFFILILYVIYTRFKPVEVFLGVLGLYQSMLTRIVIIIGRGARLAAVGRRLFPAPAFRLGGGSCSLGISLLFIPTPTTTPIITPTIINSTIVTTIITIP